MAYYSNEFEYYGIHSTFTQPLVRVRFGGKLLEYLRTFWTHPSHGFTATGEAKIADLTNETKRYALSIRKLSDADDEGDEASYAGQFFWTTRFYTVVLNIHRYSKDFRQFPWSLEVIGFLPRTEYDELIGAVVAGSDADITSDLPVSVD